MMSQSRILLALALANSVSAFLLPANPGRLGVQSAHPEVVAKVRMAATDPASAPPAAPPADPIPDPFPAYPGLKLPYGEEMPVGSQDNANEKVNDEVIPFLTGIVGFWMAQIAGKDKSDLSSLDPLQKFVADGLRKHNEAAVPDLADMPEGFKFFGGDDLAAQLCVLLESNPFYAASLTPRDGGGFEIINFDPVAEDPPYNVKILRTMNRPGPQVNFKFSVKPEGGLMIDGYEVFENGVKIENPPEDEPYGGSASPLQYFASAALYDLFYVAQCLHGPIHILHYVLTNALKWGAGDSKYKRLSPWADVYNSNVNNKYQAVATVLISTLTGNGLLTSPNGLGGSNPSATVMVKNIEAWGACSTATEFLDHWFQSPRTDLEAAGLLTEFFKHTDLGAACAISASAALEKNSDKFDSTNAKIQDYIEQSGGWPAEKNGIKTVRSLLDVMLITGVIHGGTLSMTRLFCKPEFYRWRNITDETWGADPSKGDSFSAAIGISTIMGVQQEKHVCGSKKIPTERGTSDAAEDITKGSLQKVLASYDRQSDKLKEVYQKKILERPDFNDVGFILTDYCTDFYDGKQLTIATYI